MAGMSRLQRYLGAFGNGSIMKYVANLLVSIHNVAGNRSDPTRHEGRIGSIGPVRYAGR